MKQHLVKAALAYQQRTGQTVDMWWVPKGRQSAVLELLDRAERGKRLVTKAEMDIAKGSHTFLQGLVAR